MKRCVLLLVAGVLAAAPLAADSPALEEVTQERLRINRLGMYVLGSWAAANLTAGGVGYLLDTERADFHAMNAAWNLVNLGLSVGGLIGGAGQTQPADLAEEIAAQHRIEKIFLFNAGLDVAYMTAGAFMRWGPFDQRVNQWGASLIIQGGFLFAFDVVMAVLHSRHRDYEALVTEP